MCGCANIFDELACSVLMCGWWSEDSSPFYWRHNDHIEGRKSWVCRLCPVISDCVRVCMCVSFTPNPKNLCSLPLFLLPFSVHYTIVKSASLLQLNNIKVYTTWNNYIHSKTVLTFLIPLKNVLYEYLNELTLPRLLLLTETSFLVKYVHRVKKKKHKKQKPKKLTGYYSSVGWNK